VYASFPPEETTEENELALTELSIQPELYPIDAFRSDLMSVCGEFNVEPLEPRFDAMEAHLSVETTGGLDLARVGLNADYVCRDKSGIRRDPGEHFFLVLQQKGRAHLSQAGMSTWANPGDMFVVDAAKPSMFRYEGQYSMQLSVHLPREEMLHRFGKRIYGGLEIAGDDPLAVAMRSVLAKLPTVGDPSVQMRTVEAFYSVFGALLTERALGIGHTPSADRQLVALALSMIAEHYQDPEFKTQRLADSLGVSLRRLQRAFKLIEETPHERLQAYRVRSARKQIEERHQGDSKSTISSIAFESGFADLSTFYRLYRKVYGVAPGNVPFADQ
jgi:AraC-like DNA-binding protein